jgi:hypothetical protein
MGGGTRLTAGSPALRSAVAELQRARRGSRSVNTDPRPNFALDSEPGPVPVRDLLRDRQAESGAAGVSRAHLVFPPEGLEDVRQVIRRDPGNRVGPLSLGRRPRARIRARRMSKESGFVM